VEELSSMVVCWRRRKKEERKMIGGCRWKKKR
jgi:hypothetical protein